MAKSQYGSIRSSLAPNSITKEWSGVSRRVFTDRTTATMLPWTWNFDTTITKGTKPTSSSDGYHCSIPSSDWLPMIQLLVRQYAQDSNSQLYAMLITACTLCCWRYLADIFPLHLGFSYVKYKSLVTWKANLTSLRDNMCRQSDRHLDRPCGGWVEVNNWLSPLPVRRRNNGLWQNEIRNRSKYGHRSWPHHRPLIAGVRKNGNHEKRHVRLRMHLLNRHIFLETIQLSVCWHSS